MTIREIYAPVYAQFPLSPIYSAINNHPPIRMQTLPTNQTTIQTRQKHKTRRNLARLPRSPHRRPTKLILRILLHRARDQRRPHGTRAHGIHADPLADLLVVEPAREGDDGSFAGGVV